MNIKNNLKTYINSFKNKKILLILVLNISFVLITVALIQLTKIISQPWIDKLKNVELSSIASQSQSQLDSIVGTMKGFAIFALLTAIAFMLLLILNWSVFQSMIYNLLLKKKFNFKYFEKFLLLNIIWVIPWLIIILTVLFGSKTEQPITPILILALLFLHFSFILYTLFVENNKLRQIKQALKIGTIEIKDFTIPYILIVITLIVISQLNLLNIPFLIITFINILLFSWIQSYTKDIITNIKA